MKNKVSWILSCVVASGGTLTAALFLSDNHSILFRLLMWVASLFILAVATLVGIGVSFSLSGIIYGVSQGFNRIFDENSKSTPKQKQVFYRRFYVVFFLISLAIPAKFIVDFTFAQTPGMFLFVCGAIGIAHGIFRAIWLAKKSDKQKTETIWLEE